MADAKTSTDAKPARKPRNVAKGPRSVFVIFQVLDTEGNPVKFDASSIRLVKATRNAADALAVMDKGEFPNATYKAVVVEGR